MKQLLIAVALLCVFTMPASAARLVYLNDGSVIKAKNVWRSKGMVHVLVNRDTLADFNNSEINLKKTFAKKRFSATRKVKNTKTAVLVEAGAEAKPSVSQTDKK